jgi:hypothetical protein
VDHFVKIEGARFVPDLDPVAASESFDGGDFHGSAPQAGCKTGVMNDAAIADVDAVVRVEGAGRHEMRGQGRLLARAQR